MTRIKWSRISLIDLETTERTYKGVTSDSEIAGNSHFNLNRMSPFHDHLDQFLHSMHYNDISSFIWDHFEDRGEYWHLHFPFIVQKPTKNELSLLEKMDDEYMATFLSYNGQKQKKQIDVEKLKLSESKSRYKMSSCSRYTVIWILYTIPNWVRNVTRINVKRNESLQFDDLLWLIHWWEILICSYFGLNFYGLSNEADKQDLVYNWQRNYKISSNFRNF